MKAAVYDGKKLNLKIVPNPKINNSEVLVKVKAVGVCGTDLAIANGDLPATIPIILGHELAGEIVKLGKDVNNNWLNKRVTSEINSNIDFNCYYCNQGLYTQCVSRKAIGIDIDGAFAEYIALESYLLHGIPDTMKYEEATFIEPLAAAYQTFEMMPIGKYDKIIAIFGLGKLGLLITQVALSKGLTLIVVDGSSKKLNLAKRFGAHHLINRLEYENIPMKIKTLTNGLGADIVVDTTGNPNALKDIIASCRTRGKIHVKSTHGIETPINLTDLVVRELTLYSSRCGPFDKAIKGLVSGEIQVKDLISKRFNLERISEAFESYKLSRDHIKTVITI
ncbi:MAG: zinc-binding dehydrogenase [Candidatus Odinarchaeota archaeon]